MLGGCMVGVGRFLLGIVYWLIVSPLAWLSRWGEDPLALRHSTAGGWAAFTTSMAESKF